MRWGRGKGRSPDGKRVSGSKERKLDVVSDAETVRAGRFF